MACGNSCKGPVRLGRLSLEAVDKLICYMMDNCWTGLPEEIRQHIDTLDSFVQAQW